MVAVQVLIVVVGVAALCVLMLVMLVVVAVAVVVVVRACLAAQAAGRLVVGIVAHAWCSGHQGAVLELVLTL